MTLKKIILATILSFILVTPIHAAESGDDWWYTDYDSQNPVTVAAAPTTTTGTTQATTMPISGSAETTLVLASIGLILIAATIISRSRFLSHN